MKTYILKKGTVVHVNGIPFELEENTYASTNTSELTVAELTTGNAFPEIIYDVPSTELKLNSEPGKK